MTETMETNVTAKKAETEDHEKTIPTSNINLNFWVKGLFLFFNISTIISGASIISSFTMLNNVLYKYKEIDKSMERTKEEMNKLKSAFSSNAKSINTLYTIDSVAKERLRRNVSLDEKSQIISEPPQFVRANKNEQLSLR